MSNQVISKQRVADHGEVLTGKREVNAMLDLVKNETERIDSRFLEPACGTGNFLVAILERKLAVVESRYASSQLEYERYATSAVASLYGIDILEDNVEHCRQRLFGVFEWSYTKLFDGKAKNKCRETIRYILNRNIVWGDALTLMTEGYRPGPIIFSEWSFVSGSKLKRRDFTFGDLTPKEQAEELSLFEEPAERQVSDLGKDAFLPRPVAEFPLVHFLEAAHAFGQ
ncbi:MAG: DNA methyltransferase [Chthonomonadales bacterium]